MALVGDTIEKDENAVGMGFFNLFGNLGIICGPIIGGFLALIPVHISWEIVAAGIILSIFAVLWHTKSARKAALVNL